MRINNRLLNLWVRKLEVVVTVIFLLFFLDVRAPSPIPKLMKALSYGVVLILIILYWRRLSWVLTRDIPLLLLVGTVLASIFWTVDLAKTLGSCRGLLRMFLFGAYFTTRYSLKDRLKILFWVFGIAAIFSLIVAIAIPGYGRASAHAGALQGIFLHKSKLGDAMAIGSILCLVTALKDRTTNWLAWIGFGLTAIINFLTYSSSSLVSMIVLLSLTPLYRIVKRRYKLKTILLSLVYILAGIIAILIIGNLETILVDVLGEGFSFNGRTPIWTLIVDNVLDERPLLGYGYNAFWHSDAGDFVARYAWPTPLIATQFNAHSSYMELFADLGFLGIAVYAISLVTVFIRTIVLLFSTQKIEFLGFIQFLVFVHIAGFANVGKLFAPASSYTAIYVAVCLSTAVEWQRLRIRQKRNLGTNLSTLDSSHYTNSKVL